MPEPAGKRITSGTETSPPSMKRIFAAWLTICSMASVAKSENWNSKIGRMPVSAAPTATPATAQLGDRRVHHPLGAEALDQVAGHLEGAAIDADVLAHQEDAFVGLHGVRQALPGSPAA